MLIIALIIGTILVILLHQFVEHGRGKTKRYLLGGGMLAGLFLLSRMTGGWVIYSLLPYFLSFLKPGKNETSPFAEKAKMGEEEARLVLDVEAHASDEEIEQAYRKLMKRVHPDQGGNDYVAAKVNEARNILLGKKE